MTLKWKSKINVLSKIHHNNSIAAWALDKADENSNLVDNKNIDQHHQELLCNDMEVDNQEKQHDIIPLTDEQKLDYFHNVIMNKDKESMLEDDAKTLENTLECSEYANDIFSHLKLTELKFIPKPGYMKNQTDINEKMRAILIDWLVEVHLKFKLFSETLYLTVNLIDRYLEKENVLRQHLQLVGVTSMLIASKYEEIYAPEVRDFVYITDQAYTKEEILAMEYKILTTLEFNVTTPSSFRFLERI